MNGAATGLNLVGGDMGLVYVVTGGGSGLGAATVSRLAALPATVFALDLHFAEPLADDPSQRGANRCVHCIQCDVTDNLSVTSAVQTVQAALPSEFVGVDGVVHCAGINLGGPLMEMTSDDLVRSSRLEHQQIPTELNSAHAGVHDLLTRTRRPFSIHCFHTNRSELSFHHSQLT